MRGGIARAWLAAYLGAVVGVTLIHEPAVLALLLVMVLAAAGVRRWKLLRQTLLAVAAFNLTVSAGYVVVSAWQGAVSLDYLLLANLRVVLLVYLGFWFIATVDLLAALSAWPLASLIASLTLGQIKTFERVIRDFRLAFESRNLLPPRFIDRARAAAAQTQTLLDKSLASAEESAMAMRSRGAFDD